MDIQGEYAHVAVLVQLPDGQLIAQWGRAAVEVRGARDEDFVRPYGRTFSETEYVTEVHWKGTFRMRYGAPEWAADNAAELSASISTIEQGASTP